VSGLSTQGPLGYRVIGVFKLAGAAILTAAGFGIFRLIHGDVGATLEHVATRLHLDPENRLVHEAASRLAGITPAQLKAIGAGTFSFALLETVEGVGLVLRRHWASYLTVVATALLLPLEVYEIARKPTALRWAVFVSNVVILVYLIVKLVQERRSAPAAEAP
jgi:uncharacterized membrane protein (DUF2068 family)